MEEIRMRRNNTNEYGVMKLCEDLAADLIVFTK
jgi:hypothetical protein